MSETAASVQTEVDRFLQELQRKDPHQPEFHQAVREVLESIMPVVLDRRDIQDACILERLTEPDRVFRFRVTWEDDHGRVQVQRAWRVQFNNALGPYKGGLRFHPSVNLSILKFLGFEQIFKNSLTGLPLGGGKGGSDFDPKGRSQREVMRFCQALMTELHRHIGPDTGGPAGDIGVGSREIGYLFGQYKRLANAWVGGITGKHLDFGGSAVRTEATGFGVVYFLENMLRHHGESVAGRTALVSGSGNVAQYAIQKLQQLGARVITASDGSGFIHDPAGIDEEKLAWLIDLKKDRARRIREYAERWPTAIFYPGLKPWGVQADLALPCATQNELEEEDARKLVANGVRAVAEGANMPCTLGAIRVFRQNRVLFAPGKAANAGGVAVSGLEMSQNSQRMSWTREEVDLKLQGIMAAIHDKCLRFGENGGQVDYIRGANVGGFLRVAEAMLAQGLS